MGEKIKKLHIAKSGIFRGLGAAPMVGAATVMERVRIG